MCKLNWPLWLVNTCCVSVRKKVYMGEIHPTLSFSFLFWSLSYSYCCYGSFVYSGFFGSFLIRNMLKWLAHLMGNARLGVVTTLFVSVKIVMFSNVLASLDIFLKSFLRNILLQIILLLDLSCLKN